MHALSRNPASRRRTLLRLSLARRSRGSLTSFVLFVVLPAIACTQRGLVERPEKRGTSEETVQFASGDITLAGTLVLPEGSQPHAAVVLVHGSGPQKRDLFTARWFAAAGIAALAYDKRGVGESDGDFRKVPFMKLCDDGLGAIKYLKSRKEIDAKRIGVWGLSQGGWLGPLAATVRSSALMLSAYVERTSLLPARVPPVAASRYEARESPKAVETSCSATHKYAISAAIDSPAHRSCVLADSWCVAH